MAWLINFMQCALPVFEGLLRTHREDRLLWTLLFDLVTWHAYAKLRLHTDSTLNDFRTLTSTLGKSVHVFIKEVCSQYDTAKLPHEMAVCGRREAALAKKSDTPGMSQRRLTTICKQLNLMTYKYHALGDYPDLITLFGTTDNASTQMVRAFPSKHASSICYQPQYRGNYNTRWSNVTLHVQIKEDICLSLPLLKYTRGSYNTLPNAWWPMQDSCRSRHTECDPESELMQIPVTRRERNHSIQLHTTS